MLKTVLFVLLVLSVVVLQSCVTKAGSRIVPGKEISRTVLEQPVISNKVRIKEITPYEARVIHKVCTADKVKTVNQSIEEVYYSNNKVETHEKPEKIEQTFVDTGSVVCKEMPIDDGAVNITINAERIQVKPLTNGITRIPALKISEIETGGKNAFITYQYKDAKMTTVVGSKESRETIKKYFTALASNSQFKINLTDRTGLYRQDNNMQEAILKELPKYYQLAAVPVQNRLQRSDEKRLAARKQNTPAQESDVVYRLEPKVKKMNLAFGNYLGSIDLPVIEDITSASPVVMSAHIMSKKVNHLTPNYTHEDETMKVIYDNDRLRVINKTDAGIRLNKLSMYYNGKRIDSLLDKPVELPARGESGEIMMQPVVEKDLGLLANYGNMTAQKAQRMRINFGVGATYQVRGGNSTRTLNKINNYSVLDVIQQRSRTEQNDGASMVMLYEPGEAPKELQQLLGDSAQRTSDANDPNEVQIDLRVEFDSGKDAIKKEYYGQLTKIGEALRKYPSMRGVIEGHTDSVGNEDTNQNLSERRAAAIKKYLVQYYAISTDRLQIEGFGMSRPIAENDVESGRAKNRRIEARFFEFE